MRRLANIPVPEVQIPEQNKNGRCQQQQWVLTELAEFQGPEHNMNGRRQQHQWDRHRLRATHPMVGGNIRILVVIAASEATIRLSARTTPAISRGVGGPPPGEPGTWPLATWVVDRPMAKFLILSESQAAGQVTFWALRRQTLVAYFVNECLGIVDKRRRVCVNICTVQAQHNKRKTRKTIIAQVAIPGRHRSRRLPSHRMPRLVHRSILYRPPR